MKKLIIFFLSLLALMYCCSVSCHAESTLSFDGDIRRIEDSIGEDERSALDSLGISGAEDVITQGIDGDRIWTYLLDTIRANSASPLRSLVIITAILLVAGIAESYNFSLRYTETRDVLSVVISLFTASVVISPATELVSSAVTVIRGASTVMTVYLPVMAGIMAFSGSAVASAGCYAAAVTAAQLLSRIAAAVLTPLLNLILSLSVSAGICTRVSLSGITGALSKGFKYAVSFSVSIFVAILGLNSTLFASADSVANKMTRFGLSSFIPLIGSSISEAYGALQNSLTVLRSGVGVFVILSIFVAFVPLMIRTILWSAALTAAKTVGEALCVSSSVSVLHTLLQFISALRAVLIAVMTVFIISSSVMIRIGGQL